MQKQGISNEENARFFPIIINGSNLIPSPFNNTYRYEFPAGAVRFKKGSRIAVSNINMFYSWYNITADLANNVYNITFPVAGAFTITIPDGHYSVSAINQYLQQYCISNNLYLIDSTGDYVYFIEWQENANFYKIQLNLYPVPTAAQAAVLGYTAPAGWAGYPAAATTPQVTILANNFRTYTGFSAGTYPPAPAAVNTSYLSTSTPQVNNVSSLILTCSLLNNLYANPKTILYSFSPAGAGGFGSLITSAPSEFSFVDISAPAAYPYIEISFLDQNYNAVPIIDSNIIVQLLIKNYDDVI